MHIEQKTDIAQAHAHVVKICSQSTQWAKFSRIVHEKGAFKCCPLCCVNVHHRCMCWLLNSASSSPECINVCISARSRNKNSRRITGKSRPKIVF